ncbi:MAG: hypothetical protein ACYDEJ_07675 [Desulfitobacteriaceae bacterium]
MKLTSLSDLKDNVEVTACLPPERKKRESVSCSIMLAILAPRSVPPELREAI